MATIVAIASGNWSDTTATSPWPDGVKPGMGDSVESGQFVIEIDEDITVVLLETKGGGQFTVSAIVGDGTRLITASLGESNSAYRYGILVSNPTGQVNFVCEYIVCNGGEASTLANAGIIGTITASEGICGGENEDLPAIINGQTGSIASIIAGDIQGGDGYGSSAIRNYDGTIGLISGIFTSGLAPFSIALYNESSNIINVDGPMVCVNSNQFPISGPFKLVHAPSQTYQYILLLDSEDNAVLITDDVPEKADVRMGVTYSGDMTGELVVSGGTSIVNGGGPFTGPFGR